MKILFPLAISVLFLQELRAKFINITEQKKITSTLQLENNLDKTPTEAAITTAFIVEDEKFDDNELRKLFVQKFQLYENNVEAARNKNETHEMMLQRKSRYAANSTDNKRLECLSCSADGISVADENCYKGSRVLSQNCSDAEQCYTELHPLYIKRGCILPGSLNRTFVCKCPLCNDKPSYDSTYYEYTKLSDWQYDNERLQRPVVGIDLICKVCETRRMNKFADSVCKAGQGADYMVCGHDELCYININEQIDTVTRGCIARPTYNSYYYFCNSDNCNSESYIKPILRHPTELLMGLAPLASKHSSKSDVIRIWHTMNLLISAIFIYVHL